MTDQAGGRRTAMREEPERRDGSHRAGALAARPRRSRPWYCAARRIATTASGESARLPALASSSRPTSRHCFPRPPTPPTARQRPADGSEDASDDDDDQDEDARAGADPAGLGDLPCDLRTVTAGLQFDSYRIPKAATRCRGRPSPGCPTRPSGWRPRMISLRACASAPPSRCRWLRPTAARYRDDRRGDGHASGP